MQWYAFAVVAFVMLGVGGVREVRRRDPAYVAPAEGRLRRRLAGLGRSLADDEDDEDAEDR